MAMHAGYESDQSQERFGTLALTDGAIPCLLLAYPKSSLSKAITDQYPVFWGRYPFQRVTSLSALHRMAPNIAEDPVDPQYAPLALAFASHQGAMTFVRDDYFHEFNNLFVHGVQLVSLVVGSEVKKNAHATVLLAIGKAGCPEDWPTVSGSFVDQNTPRNYGGKKVSIPKSGAAGNNGGFYSELRENAGSRITISRVRDGSLWLQGKIARGFQDGGNGSGGGDATGAYRMHSIQGASAMTFWKRDVLLSDVTPLAPESSSSDVIEKLNSGATPNFSRIFASSNDAKKYYQDHKEFLDALATNGQIVFVDVLVKSSISSSQL